MTGEQVGKKVAQLCLLVEVKKRRNPSSNTNELHQLINWVRASINDEGKPKSQRLARSESGKATTSKGKGLILTIPLQSYLLCRYAKIWPQIWWLLGLSLFIYECRNISWWIGPAARSVNAAHAAGLQEHDERKRLDFSRYFRSILLVLMK